MERFGVSTPTARAYVHLSEKAWDIPHLVGGLCAGELSFDKVRAVAEVATPRPTASCGAQAAEYSVRQLAELARSRKGASEARAESDHDRRFLRFNDRFRTLSVQLPPESLRRDPGLPRGAGPVSSPPTARRHGTSDSATPSSSWSARRCGTPAAGHKPVRRGGPRPSGRPRRGVGGDERSGRRTRARRFDQLRDRPAHRLRRHHRPRRRRRRRATPCTRAGPGGSRATPNAERSCGGTATAGSPDAPT